jgi:hypothetical protein
MEDLVHEEEKNRDDAEYETQTALLPKWQKYL